MTARSFIAASAFVLGALLASGRARAENLARPTSASDSVRWSESRMEPHYLRATLEEVGVLAAGVLQYQTVVSNSQDWDLGYDWPSLRAKLTGQAVRFDTNRFDTNMLTHPAAGTLYYLAARGNRLSPLESLLITVAASTLWEYLGEFREMASVNDLVVTPVAGAAFGEAFTSLGIFFQRSAASPTNEVLGALFAPATYLHDRIDRVPLEVDDDRDRYGLTRNIGHHLELMVGSGTSSADGGGNVDARFGAAARLLSAPGYARADRHTAGGTDTTWTRIGGEATLGNGGLRDARADFVVAPLGFYAQDVRRAHGVHSGERFFVGPTLGFAYGMHAFETPAKADTDRISGVHVLGAVADYERTSGLFRVRTSLEVRPELAAVSSLAIDEYLRRRRGDDLPSVAGSQGYYYGAGLWAAPTVEVGAGRVTVGVSARFESYRSIKGLDRRQETLKNEVALRDRQSFGRVYLALTPFAPIAPVVLRLAVDRRVRSGTITDVTTQADEWSASTTVGVSF